MSPLMKLAALAALCAGAGACQTPVDAPPSPTFGQAVASLQSQIIPADLGAEPPESSAARGVAAIKRYEAGKVTGLQNASTSNVRSSYAPTSPAVDK
jgi:hypothetical protein